MISIVQINDSTNEEREWSSMPGQLLHFLLNKRAVSYNCLLSCGMQIA